MSVLKKNQLEKKCVCVCACIACAPLYEELECKIQPTAAPLATLKQLPASSKTELPSEIHPAKNLTSKNNHQTIPTLPQTFGLWVLALNKWDLPTKAFIVHDFLFLIGAL